ncbi:hypothetical protein SPF06_09985 [Sinomonas sp. JGH33]|uniref:ABM domain-containing protein n=1 Tax=Sinomonas terricola TaxID=3110330 RepID=A0ABU5T5V9_9MICC|nr:hypothetical protein [Sinomonas sp. JGH33]MEA5455047.1 hypothetical protein [Sinomonas sp. JGH33]
MLRINSFDEAKLAEAQENLREFDRLHAAQPGFLGNLTVDLGGGRRFVLNLWRSAEDAQAGLSVLGPEVRRVVEPLLSAPSELIGMGPVISSDFGPVTSSE